MKMTTIMKKSKLRKPKNEDGFKLRINSYMKMI